MSFTDKAIENAKATAVPQTFGCYVILGVLGSGGMGVVYEAYDRELDRRIALKVLRTGLPDEAKATQRFLREAQTLAAIQHPRIVGIHDIGIEGELPYIAMDLLEGQTLEERMTFADSMRFPGIHTLAVQILEGLHEIHAQGLIHRDIKPANIWLTFKTDQVVILDFGLARRVDGQLGLTSPSLMMGTPQYISPELARGDELDCRCDLFSLGIILYEICTGRKPFEATTPLALMEQITRHHPPRISTINTEIPIPFSNLVMEMLAKYPKDRPASAEMVLHRLKAIRPSQPQFIATEVVPSGEQAVWVRPRRAKSKGKSSFWFYLALAAILSWSSWMWLSQPRSGRLEIITPVSNVEVEVWQNSHRVATSIANRMLDLPAGDYHLTLVHAGDRLKLSETDIRIPADGSKTVRIVAR